MIRLILICLILVGCQQEKPSSNTFTLSQQLYHPTVHAHGTINPSCYKIVVSPVDGYIENVKTSYGSDVIKATNLMRIEDPKISNEYISLVIKYLENKEKVRKARSKLEGEQELFRAGVVARNDLEDDQYSYNAAKISYMRSIVELKEYSIMIGRDYKEIESMNLQDIDAISKTIAKHFAIHVTSPSKGRWMSPILLNSINKTDLKAVYAGNKVEKGQVLGFILDDTCGIQVKFLVGQEHIKALKKDMQVVIKSSSLPGDLYGKITKVGRYDVMRKDTNSPLLFPVIAKIVNLPEAVDSMGLLALGVDVVVDLGVTKQLRVPLTAIHFDQEQPYVIRVDSQGRQSKVKVVLGKSDLHDVEVISGLAINDVVLLHD